MPRSRNFCEPLSGLKMSRGWCYCRRLEPGVGFDAVAALSSKTMPTTQDTNERRPAVWPWILMPIVVLVVFYTLHSFQDAAKSAAARAHESDTSEQAAQ